MPGFKIQYCRDRQYSWYNPLKGRGVNWLHLAIQVLTAIFNFWHLGTRAEHQSARMSEIKNGRLYLDDTEYFEM